MSKNQDSCKKCEKQAGAEQNSAKLKVKIIIIYCPSRYILSASQYILYVCILSIISYTVVEDFTKKRDEMIIWTFKNHTFEGTK